MTKKVTHENGRTVLVEEPDEDLQKVVEERDNYKKIANNFQKILKDQDELKSFVKSVTEPDVYDMLLEFHKVYGAAINQPFTEELKNLRHKLIYEESLEVEDELYPFNSDRVDRKKLTKELADLMYVTIGTAVTFGLPLREVFAEVHKSNMSKLGLDGKPIYREDGKVLKGPDYKEPDLDKYFIGSEQR